jgi:hypothetical protein
MPLWEYTYKCWRCHNAATVDARTGTLLFTNALPKVATSISTMIDVPEDEHTPHLGNVMKACNGEAALLWSKD